jgi:S1-C subfamily serine protease
MEYNVQRAIGVEGGELNATASKALGINQTEGFYVGAVTKNSGAEKSGLKRRYYRKNGWSKDCYLCGPVWIYQYQKTQ